MARTQPKEIVDNSEPVFVELEGIGYNIMLQRPDKFDKFKIDLVVDDPEQQKKLEDLADKYGLSVRSSFNYPKDGEVKTIDGVMAITLRAKYVDGGQYPRKFIPTFDDHGNVIKEFVEHGAKLTARFKIFGYSGGDNYSAGNGIQLERVTLHEYTPFEKSESA